MMQAREMERLEGYGPGRDMFMAMAEAFATREGQDPQIAVDRLVELAEAEPAKRPLRSPVGEDVTAVCDEINDVVARSQVAIMNHFGFD
jgi:hypothetical protein